MSIPATFGIERLNIVIFALKSSTLIPYVLYITKNVFDKEELNKMYGILESYMMRRMVVQATTRNYNHLFTSLILNSVLDSDSLLSRLKDAGDSTTYIPTDEDVENAFFTSKLINLQSKGIIYLIESSIRPADSAVALLGIKSYSLEHLMPKKWRNNWEYPDNEELAHKRDSKLLTLGNLAIITQSLNSSIRDADWETKKQGKGATKPGLSLCASGLMTMVDVLSKDTWDEECITERSRWLCQQGLKLWKLC